MLFFKTFIDATIADDKLSLLSLEAIGLRFRLQCYIAKSPVMNYMYRTVDVPYSDQEIADIVTIELQKWLQLKKELLTYGGFALDSKNAVGIPKWSEHQSDYYRQKKYRYGYNKSYNKVTGMVTDMVTHRSKKLEVRSKKVHSTIPSSPLSEEQTKNTAMPPDPGEKYIITTDLQHVICGWKDTTGYKIDDRSWDKAHWSRCCKPAKALLEFLGSWEKAVTCADYIYTKLTKAGLNCTLETVLKHSADWKNQNGNKYERD